MISDAEEAVAMTVTREVCEGQPCAVASTRTETHHVVGLAVELDRHPCGMRQIPPPVVVAFCREQWLRIALMLKALERAS